MTELKLKLSDELAKVLVDEIYKQNKSLFSIDIDEREIKITFIYVEITEKTGVEVTKDE